MEGKSGKHFLKPKQVAHLLGISVSSVYRRIQEGSLKAEKFGSLWLIDADQLPTWATRREP